VVVQSSRTGIKLLSWQRERLRSTGMTQVAIGRMDEARQEAALFMVSNPHFTISFWAASHLASTGSSKGQFRWIEGKVLRDA
jgi:hypothetical protein